ncbi:uncharacterized protein LAESUDRAFT_755209 [Laetiporus sulphureus 93-53]|uniref:Uncharacterized protein n=1 Tax=Laetiporus sulphureus 93-53 TaxID=1314785 RepID=A0A165HD30_9APHY|nr:uncharacterized protein LAESUDRAFT_755209 [Laetiporus sulphureus 93-53]KZT11573.1 hypothetical protein LAESUDRAFT_755209 [Laetiporus sulphureus 93-53]
MAAVLNPSSYVPRQGILLNRSPSVSPYRHSIALPHLVPSNSSLSSTTSSASNLNTSDSEHYLSSNPGSPKRASRPPPGGHDLKPRAGSMPTSRRIRFAPLPDPRRDLFITSRDDPSLSPVFLDDWCDPKGSQNLNASSSGQSHLSLKDQDTKIRSAPSGSLLFNNDPGVHHSASESTHTLASTATIIPYPAVAGASSPHGATPSDLEGGDWNVLPSSRASSINLPDEPPRRSNSNGNKWSKKLLKPWLSPLSKSSNRSTDELHSSASTTSLTSLNSIYSSPRSPDVEGCMALGAGSSSRNEKGKEKSKKKRRDKVFDPDCVHEFGTPLYRWTSEGGDSMGIQLDKRGRRMIISDSREASPESRKNHERERQRIRSGSGTRMLNGRVYGAKRMNGKNAFANVRTEEPEFVEWGYGGMGSVRASGGAGIWSRLQAGSGVSIGAHESDSKPRGRPSTANSARDDDDDGSGMAWVKRRREQRERELREQERKEREQQQQTEENTESSSGSPVDSLVGTESPSVAEPHSSVSDPDSPHHIAPSDAPADILSSSPASMAASLPGTSSPKNYVLTAVTLPPDHYAHHHSHSLSRSTIERLPSIIRAEVERKDSADTARNVPPPQGQTPEHAHVSEAPAMASKQTEGVAEGRERRESVRSELSITSFSSTSTSEYLDDADVDEDEKENHKDDDDDDEEEEELENGGRLALGAGVEKVSRHKQSPSVQNAASE